MKYLFRLLVTCVAAVLISSCGGSGSTSSSGGGNDTTQGITVEFNLDAQHEAARQILNFINPISISESREYGGYIYINPDGSYGATDPLPGTVNRISLPDRSEITPEGSITTAIYHTHGSLPNAENFSSLDISWFTVNKTDGYVSTSQGTFKYYDLATGEVTTLGTVQK